jgi:hypothetical protein
MPSNAKKILDNSVDGQESLRLWVANSKIAHLGAPGSPGSPFGGPSKRLECGVDGGRLASGHPASSGPKSPNETSGAGRQCRTPSSGRTASRWGSGRMSWRRGSPGSRPRRGASGKKSGVLTVPWASRPPSALVVFAPGDMRCSGSHGHGALSSRRRESRMIRDSADACGRPQVIASRMLRHASRTWSKQGDER